MRQGTGREKVSFLPLSFLSHQSINHSLVSSPVQDTGTATKVLKAQVMEKMKDKYALSSEVVYKKHRGFMTCGVLQMNLWKHLDLVHFCLTRMELKRWVQETEIETDMEMLCVGVAPSLLF